MNCSHLFSSFPDSARIWVYTPSRPLEDHELETAQNTLNTFVAQWQAHGAALRAQAEVFGPGFLLIAVDENQAQASGCSIDSSMRVVQDLEKTLNITFLDRMNVWHYAQNGWQISRFPNLSFVPDELIFDATVSTVGDLRSKGIVKASTSWLGVHL